MKTLENLKKLHEAILNDPYDGFVLSNSLKELTTKIIEMETQFQYINESYEINFEPVSIKNLNGNKYHLNIKLLYNEQEIASHNTEHSFVFLNGSEDYISSPSLTSHYGKTGISKEITFYKKPQLYAQFVEDSFITSFLNNEKLLAQTNMTKQLNKDLKSGNSIKFKI